MVLYRQPVSTGTRLGGWAAFLFFLAVSAGSVWVAISGDWISLGTLLLSLPFALAGLRYAIGTLQWSIEGQELLRVGMMGPVPTFPMRFALSGLEGVRVEHHPELKLWVVQLTGPSGTPVEGFERRAQAEELALRFAEGLGLAVEPSPDDGA